jgi:predicted nucleotidyltransferase
MVFYKLNSRETAVKQIKIMTNVFALTELTDRLKEECRRIALFGSCAQGTDAKDSDIDLFVLTSTKDSVRRKMNEFKRGFTRKIAPIIVDANEFMKLRREDRPLYENVERGVVLWQEE